jgi:hypothetical protein
MTPIPARYLTAKPAAPIKPAVLTDRAIADVGKVAPLELPRVPLGEPGSNPFPKARAWAEGVGRDVTAAGTDIWNQILRGILEMGNDGIESPFVRK